MWPQTQPVTAPKAPVSAGEQEQADAEQAPLRLDRISAETVARVRLGGGASSGGGGRRRRCGGRSRSRRRRGGAPRRPPRAPAARRAGARNGPASAASRPRGPCCTTRPASSTATCSARSVVDSRCATRMPVRPAISRSAARTTRASVTGSIRAVASSSTTTRTSRTSSRANATSCSSPGGQAGAARAEQGVEALGQPGHPVGRGRARRPRPRPGARGASPNSVMFSARVPARISVRWVTTPTAARSCCRSRSSTSTPPSSTVPRGGSTARDSSDASVDLPEPVRPTSAQV